MSLPFYYLRKAAAALVAEGNTPEQAADIIDRANAGDLAAQAQAQAALQSDPSQFKYKQLERPRMLEEGLPIPPDYAFWAAIVYMMKKEPAMLERLAKQFMETQGQIISHLAQAGAGNLVTAYSHSFLIGLMLEQNYMIRQRGADDLIASLNVLVGAQALTNLLQGFAVPEVLTFAATGIPIKGTKLK